MEIIYDQSNIKAGSAAMQLHLQQPEMSTEGLGQLHIIFLHGWNSKARDMERMKKAITSGLNAHLWSLDYDSNNFSFYDAARQLTDSLLHQSKYDFTRTVLIGYSMGGIVARQMVNFGFPFKALVSICSPHAGIMYPLGTDTGSMSLIPASQDLNHLNRTDNYARKYHCFGIYSNDSFGDHRDDGVVGIDSAVAKNLWPVAYTNATKLVYEGGGAFTDPHQHGMNPDSLPNLVQYCRSLISKV